MFLLNNKCLGNLGGNRKRIFIFFIAVIHCRAHKCYIFYSMEGKGGEIIKQWLYNLFLSHSSQAELWRFVSLMYPYPHEAQAHTNGRIFPTSSICKHPDGTQLWGRVCSSRFLFSPTHLIPMLTQNFWWPLSPLWVDTYISQYNRFFFNPEGLI